MSQKKNALFSIETIKPLMEELDAHQADRSDWAREDYESEAFYSFRRFDEAAGYLAGTALNLDDDFLRTMNTVLKDCSPGGALHEGGYVFTQEMADKVHSAATLISQALGLLIEVGEQNKYSRSDDINHWKGCKAGLDCAIESSNNPA